jgi:short-subunit dehydrogenase
MPRKLRDSVVVVTGASSGIGKATALAFAREGAAVVVTARRQDALNDVAHACTHSGAQTLAIAADVTDADALRDVANSAIERFGRIDVWVNNAGVTAFGRFEETPADVFQRVMEVNFFGTVNGARVALPYFREQGEGVLINTASMVGEGGAPYMSAYTASKSAILSFAESLRMELLDVPDIHVCSVLPAAIDTPFFQHAANFTGREPKPINPVYDAEVVAETILDLARKPRREEMAGNAGRMAALTHRVMPGAYERMTARLVHEDHFKDQPAAPTTGNLFEPSQAWTGVSGGWTTNGGHAGPSKKLLGLGLGIAAAGIFLARDHVPGLRR